MDYGKGLEKQGKLLCQRVPLGSVIIGGGRRVPSPMSGWPDCVLIFPGGQFVGCEFKRPKKGKMRPSQLKFAERCRTLNIPCYRVESLNQFIAVVDRYIKT